MITLGIIGVVAAITIPTLIQNTNSKKFSTQFKKTLSSLSQASLMAQAQYDVDFSLATDIGSGTDVNCDRVNIASGNTSVCGILNGTLTGYAHLGKYTEVKGADGKTAYSYAKAQETFYPDANYELLQLADGSIFGFNIHASNCSLTPGKDIKTALSTGLENCMGFIDVNGVTAPNREVSCSNVSTELDPSKPCALGRSGATIGDVYPVVFHDGTVEPATNAGRSVLAMGLPTSSGGSGEDTASAPSRKKVTYNGDEYEWYDAFSRTGEYFRKDDEENLVSNAGSVYIKQPDGTYLRTAFDGDYYYDDNMALQYIKKSNGERYDYCNISVCYKKDGDDYVSHSGTRYVKQPDGTYKNGNYYYDEDMNQLYLIQNGRKYLNKGSVSVAEIKLLDSNGQIMSVSYWGPSGEVYAKQSDGTFTKNGNSSNTTIHYDENFNVTHIIKNGERYDYYKNSGLYIKNDGGNYVGVDGATFTKNSDGLYQDSYGYVYDDDFNLIYRTNVFRPLVWI